MHETQRLRRGQRQLLWEEENTWESLPSEMQEQCRRLLANLLEQVGEERPEATDREPRSNRHERKDKR